MDNQTELSKEQKEALEESLRRGQFFEQLIRSDGWKLIQAYYQNRIQVFATNILTSKEDIQTFEHERWEIIGLKKLLGMIENDIETLKKHNESEKPTKK